MRLQYVITIIVVLSATPILAAQKTSEKKTPSPSTPIALSGCVARSPTADDQFTLLDNKDGSTYRLTGADVHDFVGHRVQIAGRVVGSKKIQVEFGLKPSPNVAAQAGAIDPSQAATATAGGLAPTGNVRLPEFRVRTVRPLGATCP
jgi:hypothetical protein